MAVNVYNRQRARPIDVQALRRFLEDLSRRLGADADFSVILIGDAAMARYNSRYRRKAGSTDVLSFPGQRDPWDDEGYLGDILVSVETAERQRRSGIEQELKVLCLHGLLHLLGYDHETDHGEMTALETRLKKELQLS